MQTIQEIQDEIVRDFEQIGDPFDQYAYLVELACAHTALAPEEKTQDCLVEGCQSRVWIRPRCKNGLFWFSSDSDTLIIKGVLSLLERLFCGQSCMDVAAAQVDFLHRTFIMETFETDRQKGIGYVISALRQSASAFCHGES